METTAFTDGLWHSVTVDIESGIIAENGKGQVGVIKITVDGITDLSQRQLTFTTTSNYFIGGLLKIVLIVSVFIQKVDNYLYTNVIIVIQPAMNVITFV